MNVRSSDDRNDRLDFSINNRFRNRRELSFHLLAKTYVNNRPEAKSFSNLLLLGERPIEFNTGAIGPKDFLPVVTAKWHSL